MAATAAAPAVSIGNYKGVMLCNRPFVFGSATTNKGAPAAPSKQAFICGSVGEKLGTNVPISSKDKAIHNELLRPKKETVLQKHRKWLEELQATKEQLDKQHADDAKAKADRQKRFMQREAKLRAIIRKSKQQALEHGVDTSSQEKVCEDSDLRDAKAFSDDDKAVPELEDKVDSLEAQAKLRRPMWALTEKQADEATDMVDKEEADELLEFAHNLDFDKYINDSEVSALITNVRARIHELETDKQLSDQMETKSEASVDRQLGNKVNAMKLTMESLKAIDSEIPDDHKADDDAVSVAQSLLESETGKALAGVHSKKSLSVVAERSKQAALEALEEEPSLPKPVIIKHTDDEGTRLEAKKAVNNLPYMHRNPAV